MLDWDWGRMGSRKRWIGLVDGLELGEFASLYFSVGLFVLWSDVV